MIYRSLQSKKFFSGGYTLLFAVLVSSVVLAIGISILNISKKEFLLASSARESTSAFYAADTGLECAMYWNSTGIIAYVPGTTPIGTPIASIDCAESLGVGIKYNPTFVDVPADAVGAVVLSTFHININNNTCAIVSVEKYKVNKGLILGIVRTTRFTSRGYNIGWDSTANGGVGSCNKPSPRRVERALRFTS